MTCGEENLHNDLLNFDIAKIKSRVVNNKKQLLKLQNKIINKNNLQQNDVRIIQRGYMGVGLHYFLGIKENNDSSRFAHLLQKYAKKEIT